jgi:hypothetical protein
VSRSYLERVKPDRTTLAAAAASCGDPAACKLHGDQRAPPGSVSPGWVRPTWKEHSYFITEPVKHDELDRENLTESAAGAIVGVWHSRSTERPFDVGRVPEE